MLNPCEAQGLGDTGHCDSDQPASDGRQECDYTTLVRYFVSLGSHFVLKPGSAKIAWSHTAYNSSIGVMSYNEQTHNTERS